MKSLHVGTGYNLCRVSNYHHSHAPSYEQSGILPRLDGMLLVWFGHMVLVELSHGETLVKL
jgi:hypothetical protein